MAEGKRQKLVRRKKKQEVRVFVLDLVLNLFLLTYFF
jgi:hypothetical protein